MFTGIIVAVGVVDTVDRLDAGRRLVVRSDIASELIEGDSIAVNGVCLTVTALGPGRVAADVMHETLNRSTLGDLSPDDQVNLELAMRASDRVGGHLVQGHVDSIGIVRSIQRDGIAQVMGIETEPSVLRFVAEKGSVAIDGISLTVARVDSEGFDVSLIPETLRRTTLKTIAAGARVNIETDVVAKYLARLVEREPADRV